MEKKYTLQPGLFLAYFIICIINFAFGLISSIVDWSTLSSVGLGNTQEGTFCSIPAMHSSPSMVQI